ncbi:hypothetical protein FQA39_LY05608 [Lamprigera yunnana]|nr:hypothetical protein FQA39_LY05608 [Lamprigera yunnana]
MPVYPAHSPPLSEEEHRRHEIKKRNWKDSMDEAETEEASLTESAFAIGDGGAYADIWKHTDMRGNDSNENEATTCVCKQGGWNQKKH